MQLWALPWNILTLEAASNVQLNVQWMEREEGLRPRSIIGHIGAQDMHRLAGNVYSSWCEIHTRDARTSNSCVVKSWSL